MADFKIDEDDLLKENTLSKRDSIFKTSPNWSMNSCLNYDFDMTATYAQGFKVMAQIGVEAIRINGSHQDTLVYPIVFNFRHHVELLLKIALKYGYNFLDRKQGVPKSHDLDLLWKDLNGVLIEVKMKTSEFPDASELKNAKRIINELARLDPEGESFRYAKKKSGESSIDQNLTNLNLESFSEAVEKLSNFLESVGSHLGHLSDYKNEAESEMRQMNY